MNQDTHFLLITLTISKWISHIFATCCHILKSLENQNIGYSRIVIVLHMLERSYTLLKVMLIGPSVRQRTSKTRNLSHRPSDAPSMV
jgi:hypothetical protein